MRHLLFWILFIFAISLYAEDKPFLELDVLLSNDLIFRGESFNGALVNDKYNTKNSSYTDAWNLQPELRFLTPIDGLVVFLWGNINVQHYGDRDSDQYLFQNGAGEFDRTNEILGKLNSGDLGFDLNQVKRYKEKNGASRWNSAFLGSDYSWDTRLGGLSFGTWFWASADPASKYIWQEWFFRYRPPILSFLNPEFGFYINTSASNQGNAFQQNSNVNGQKYISLDLEHIFWEGNFVEVEVSSHFGYLIKNDNLNRRSGVSNITNSLRFIIDKFYFGGSWIYRPELDVYDRYDSNSNDGRIADPSKLYGINNQIVQDQILSFVSNDPALANIVYQSITSQKIVRNLFIIEIGYRTIF